MSSAMEELTARAEAQMQRLTQVRPKRDFTDIGVQIIASLLKAADDQVTEAENLRASVKVLAEGIAAQLEEHNKLLNKMDERMKAFGVDVLDAHKKFIDGGRHENPSP